MKNLNLFFALANLSTNKNSITFDAYYNFSNEPQKLEIKKEELAAFRLYIISDPRKIARIFQYIIEQKIQISEAIFNKPTYYEIKNKKCLEWNNNKTYEALMNLFNEEEKSHIFEACTSFNKIHFGGRTIQDYYLNNGTFKAGDIIEISDEHRHFYGQIIRTANNSPIYFIHSGGTIDIIFNSDKIAIATNAEKEIITALEKATANYTSAIDTKYLPTIASADEKAEKAEKAAAEKAEKAEKEKAEKAAKAAEKAKAKAEKAAAAAIEKAEKAAAAEKAKAEKAKAKAEKEKAAAKAKAAKEKEKAAAAKAKDAAKK
jgi:chemotaxis protein histidine kinase CheA